MDKKMVLVTVEFITKDGTTGVNKFSEEFNDLMKPEEYAAYYQERAKDQNNAKRAKAVSVEVTKHKENGEYLTDAFGGRTWKTLYSDTE